MNFVSLEFAYLFAVIFFLLWAIPSPLIRKIIILSASCFFYAYWDWRLAFLLFGFIPIQKLESVSAQAAAPTISSIGWPQPGNSFGRCCPWAQPATVTRPTSASRLSPAIRS